MSEHFTRDLVVIGASWGGMRALQRLLGGLPENFAAGVLVVLHLSPEVNGGHLVSNLSRELQLPVKLAADGDPIRHGRVLVAPPDRHLLVSDGKDVMLSAGPRENRHRPAIDALFRSAARYFGPRTVGLVLTGALDDGSAGLSAVARCGGVALVQNPDDAEMPDMPAAALAAVPQAVVARLDDLPSLLQEFATFPAPPEREIPEDVLLETELAASATGSFTTEEALGELVGYSCPDCGGPLWRVDDPNVHRFRCHTGHAHTARSLSLGQGESMRAVLWAAYRAMQERRRLLDSLARDAAERGHERVEKSYRHDAEQLRKHEAAMRAMLFSAPAVSAG